MLDTNAGYQCWIPTLDTNVGYQGQCWIPTMDTNAGYRLCILMLDTKAPMLGTNTGYQCWAPTLDTNVEVIRKGIPAKTVHFDKKVVFLAGNRGPSTKPTRNKLAPLLFPEGAFILPIVIEDILVIFEHCVTSNSSVRWHLLRGSRHSQKQYGRNTVSGSKSLLRVAVKETRIE